jgi:two-component system nitrate/nitrite response regulator NarP
VTRVLLADDHPIIISGIEMLLRDTQYEIVAKLSDGAEVLTALAATKPDILILDVHMPERTGVDVLRTLRSRGDERPVILLTAGLDDHRLLEAMRLNVNGIVLKHGGQDLLVNCLDTVRSGGRWIDRKLLERALDCTLQQPAAAENPLASLTNRERSVIELVAQGMRNKEIANELGITEGTVKVYLHKIYETLGVSNRTELALWAKSQLAGS